MPADREDQPATVLLIEDNPGDVELIKEALEEIGSDCNLEVCQTGFEAIDKLNAAKDTPEALPDLILLDLNLPGKDGREVLEEIKEDRHLFTIPIVVLTSSDAEEDILRAYQLRANSYVRKPLDFDRLVDVFRILQNYWLGIVKLPRR